MQVAVALAAAVEVSGLVCPCCLHDQVQATHTLHCGSSSGSLRVVGKPGSLRSAAARVGFEAWQSVSWSQRGLSAKREGRRKSFRK